MEAEPIGCSSPPECVVTSPVVIKLNDSSDDDSSQSEENSPATSPLHSAEAAKSATSSETEVYKDALQEMHPYPEKRDPSLRPSSAPTGSSSSESTGSSNPGFVTPPETAYPTPVSPQSDGLTQIYDENETQPTTTAETATMPDLVSHLIVQNQEGFEGSSDELKDSWSNNMQPEGSSEQTVRKEPTDTSCDEKVSNESTRAIQVEETNTPVDSENTVRETFQNLDSRTMEGAASSCQVDTTSNGVGLRNDDICVQDVPGSSEILSCTDSGPTPAPPVQRDVEEEGQQQQMEKQQMPAPIQYQPFPSDHCPSTQAFNPEPCPPSPVVILESACPAPPAQPTAIYQPPPLPPSQPTLDQVSFCAPCLPFTTGTSCGNSLHPVGQGDHPFPVWSTQAPPTVYVSSVESLPLYPPMNVPNWSTSDLNNNVCYPDNANCTSSAAVMSQQSQMSSTASSAIQQQELLQQQPYPPGEHQNNQDYQQNQQQGQDLENNNLDTMASIPNPMVYPLIYVSPAGLLTVLLQHDVAVEMTIDRTLRVVNHRHKSVAATSSRGNASCIYHSGAKIYQYDTTTEVDVFWDRRAKMTPDSMQFAFGPATFELAAAGLKVAEPCFMDLSKDMSVSLLFSASGYGPHLVKHYEGITEKSRYKYLKDGGLVVFINGIKIHQSAFGDVTVTAGRKRIRVSPVYGSLYVDTHFVEMAVEMNWNIKVRRGSHRLHASFAGFILCDGQRECGFDAYRQVFCQPMLVQMHTIIWNEYPEEFDSMQWRPYWETPYRSHSRPRRFPSRRSSSTYNARYQNSKNVSSERILPVQRVRSRSSERRQQPPERFRNMERTQSATNC